MKITRAQYTEFGTIVATVNGVEVIIPDDIGNRHRQEIENQGITIKPPPTPTTTLEEKRKKASLSRAQFLASCLSAGIIDEETAEEAADGSWPAAFAEIVANLPVEQRINAKATWADGFSVSRNNPILALIASERGVTEEQLDAMFGVDLL